MCCLLALLGAHHFLHISRIRVKSLTLRLLMSYIYIIYINNIIYYYIVDSWLVLAINTALEARRANRCAHVDMMSTLTTDRDHVADVFATGI
jgi:hypothetical protein